MRVWVQGGGMMSPQKFDGGVDGVFWWLEVWISVSYIIYLFIFFGEAAVIFKGGLFAMEKVVEKQQQKHRR